MNTLTLRFLFLFLISFNLVYAQTVHYESYQDWRIGLSGGMSYLIGSAKDAKSTMVGMGIDSQDANRYYNGFKWGLQGGADAHYFFSSKLGAGLKYLFCSNSASLDKEVSLPFNGDGVSLLYGSVQEHIYVNYIGPSICSREFFGYQDEWAMVALLSVGYLHYRNEMMMTGIPVLMTGNTVGLRGEIGLEYSLSSNIALGLDVGYLFAVLSDVKLKATNGSQNMDLGQKKENLSRFDVGISLRFYM